MDYEAFEAQWSSGRVADPGAGSETLPVEKSYTALALVKQFMSELHGVTDLQHMQTPMSLWSSPTADLLKHFQRLGTTDVVEGDVIILRDERHSEGHTGIATGIHNTSQCEIMEQNGDEGSCTGTNGDAIRLRYVDKSNIMGLYRPYQEAAITEPSDIDLAELMAVADPEGVTLPAPKQANILNWHRHQSAPSKSWTERTIAGVSYKALPSTMMMYAILSNGVHKEAIPCPSTVYPRTPNDKPLGFSDYVPISGTATLKDGRVLCITTDDWGDFVRTGLPANYLGYDKAMLSDKFPQPVVVPQPRTVTTEEVKRPVSGPAWKRSYVAYEAPVLHVIMEDMTVRDMLGEGTAMPVPQHKEVLIHGEFWIGGIHYGRLRLDTDDDFHYWYGIAFKDSDNQPLLIPESDLYDASLSTPERKAMRKYNFGDYVTEAWTHLEKYSAEVVKRVRTYVQK